MRIPTINIEERRARLAVRHHLAPAERVGSVVAAARDLVCLHASDPSSVYLSAWARVNELTIEDVDRALYDERLLVRMLAMRRTMFVFPADEAGIFQSAAASTLARTERKRNRRLVEMLGVKRVSEWLRDAEAAALEALEKRGEATARDLAADVPALGEKVRINVGKPYEGSVGMSSRILIVLALEGKVVRARPQGTWVSNQYRWAPMSRWLGRELRECPEAEARADVVRRWLSRFGPGTETDIRWWTGWSARDVRKALGDISAVKVDLEGRTGFILPRDLASTPATDPWVALLPSLDPTTMGWKERDWYLGSYQDVLFDSNGNSGPTIWVDGRIVGGWAMRPDGEVVTKLLQEIGREDAQAVDSEAGRLTNWLQRAGAVPKFPSPLRKELIG